MDANLNQKEEKAIKLYHAYLSGHEEAFAPMPDRQYGARARLHTRRVREVAGQEKRQSSEADGLLSCHFFAKQTAG